LLADGQAEVVCTLANSGLRPYIGLFFQGLPGRYEASCPIGRRGRLRDGVWH
jgi:hypothetical protein